MDDGNEKEDRQETERPGIFGSFLTTFLTTFVVRSDTNIRLLWEMDTIFDKKKAQNHVEIMVLSNKNGA